MNDSIVSHEARSTPVSRLDGFSSSASMSLFTYGTLLFPDVLHAIIGRVPQNHPVSAEGWRVAALANRVYPGLVPASGETAHGRLLTGLSDSEWRLLDSFEDPKYELRQIRLKYGQCSLAYVWVDDAEVCSNIWDPGTFSVTHLSAYVARCAARYGRSETSA